jgi:hypothetical protein
MLALDVTLLLASLSAAATIEEERRRVTSTEV